ncbi:MULTISPECIES: Na+-dependent transporter [Ramlibacter]|uniref:Na+-dependent transporter n=1 Tax=Ramlibacter pinisoli TaxID=2682844 RepID=A0A6N8IR85_9BURK|nr:MULTISPECIES: Na+-dependent transporter [Ramlibacter]MBA2963794.1 Na+-dependent transporter [Ramlibacter sp. CGMCC 1.13660]MVQ28760.1 Na+-dependent transporter [Ramlibacter pinisoli]
MTLAQLIPLAISFSMAGLLLAIALETSFTDLVYLLRRPSLLLRSVLAMNVIMPLFAIALALVFLQELERAVVVSLVAMSLGPVPPILPGKGLKAGGPRSYTMGLVFLSAALSIVLVPAMVALLGYALHKPVRISTATIAGIVGTWMLLPLLLGAALRHVAPSFAQRAARPLTIASNLLLLLACIPVVVQAGPKMLELVGNFTVVAVIVFTLAGLGIGHMLGGPDPDERTVLALSTCTRHPAVAIAVLHAEPDRPSILAALLLILIVGSIVSAPYMKWRAAQQADALRASKHA